MADYNITKKIKLDLNGIPEEVHAEVKEAVGEHIVNSVLDAMAAGESPVEGEKAWKQLDKKYAEKFHGGDRTPRLELEGDLKAALGFEPTDNGLIVGILDDSQAPKADGHNNFSGQSSLPRRRFIPSRVQEFNSDIMDEVENIIESYRADAQAQAELDAEELLATGEGISANVFGNQSIADLLLQRLLGR